MQQNRTLTLLLPVALLAGLGAAAWWLLAPDRPAEDGIARERRLTEPLRSAADSVIDTTDLTPAELRDELRRRYGDEGR